MRFSCSAALFSLMKGLKNACLHFGDRVLADEAAIFTTTTIGGRGKTKRTEQLEAGRLCGMRCCSRQRAAVRLCMKVHAAVKFDDTRSVFHTHVVDTSCFGKCRQVGHAKAPADSWFH